MQVTYAFHSIAMDRTFRELWDYIRQDTRQSQRR